MHRQLPALLVLAILALPARAAPTLTTEDRARVEKLIVHRVFPGPTADSPLACAWEQATCVPSSTHLTFAPPAPIPTLAACQGTSATIAACYKAAVTRLQDALTAGSTQILFEAAYRTRDVIARAKQAGTGVPAWLKEETPTNLLYQFFAAHGMPLAQVGNCRTGTVDQKYTCLGALPRTVYRGALNALDEHNAILVRNNQLAGARSRALAIFTAGSAPMMVGIAARNAFDPTIGAGAAYVQQLGKYFFLRAYEGQMTASAENAEVVHLDSLKAYKPAALAAAPTAYTMLVAANRGAGRWDRTAQKTVVVDPALRGDVVELARIGQWTRALAGVREQVTLEPRLDALSRALAEPMTANNLDQLISSGWWIAWDEVQHDLALTQAGSYADACGWISIEDILGTERQQVEETYQETYLDRDCLEECEGLCVHVEPKTGTCEYLEEYCTDMCTTTRTKTHLVWKDVTVVIGQDITTQSLTEGYWELLESNVTSPYDFDNDGDPDLNYTDPNTATIANAGVWAGNATEGCLGELDLLGSQYSTTFNVVGDGANTDGVNGVDEDITNTFGASGASGWDFVPYPIAARICPSYTRDVVGLGAGTVIRPMSLRAVNQTTGSIATMTYGQTCDTPWAYTNRVADLLGDPTLTQLRAEMQDDLVAMPGSETLATTIIDFANEAWLLSLPVSGAFQQRADLAYVAGDVPNGSTSAWYGEHTGLDHLDASLSTAASPLGKGIDLVIEFGAVVTGVTGATGAEAIPQKSQAGFNTCTGTGCGDNSTTQLRATFYKRLRDALDLYQRNARDRFEVQWRRLDGQIDSACFTTTDTDSDGSLDSMACDAATSGCSAICESFADGDELIADATEKMTGVRDMLLAQEAYLANSELLAFTADLRTFADGIVADLQLRRARQLSGIDYLGNRNGRWVPAIEVDAETDLDVLLGTLDASSDSFGYEAFVDDYLQNIAVTAEMASAEETATIAAYDGLANYCHDTDNVVRENGCGIASSWTTTAAQIAAVNADIRTNVCEAKLRLYRVDEEGVTSWDERTIDATDPALAGYLSQLAGMGFADGCPQLMAPSFATLGSDFGTVADALGDLHRQMLAVQQAVAAIKTATTRMEDDSYAASQLGTTLYTYEDQQKTLEDWVDATLCGMAITGAAAVCGAGTYTSFGAGAAACVPEIGAATAACAELANNDWGDNNGNEHISEEEVQEAYYQFTVALQTNAALAELAGDLDAFVGTTFDFSDAALAYQSAQLDFERAIAVTNQTMEGLYASAAVDPTAWFFQDQQFMSVKASFADYAGDVRDARQLVEYATGHAIGEDIALPLGANSYCVPRLADITVFKSYGANFDAARNDLAAMSCADPEVGEMNLVAAASVLAEVSLGFGEVYGLRTETQAWIVGAGSAVGGIDRDGDGDADLDDDELAMQINRGEWAMLADSGFYNPLGYVDVDSDGDGVKCAVGQIDLDDVCAKFTSNVVVPDDSCFDPRTLSQVVRTNLAYLDHMVRGQTASTFACTRTALGGGQYTYTVAAAVPTYFTYAQLGGTPSWFTAPTGTENWHEGIPNGITQGYYNAQTRTVRAVYDRFFAEVEASDSSLGVASLNRMPGTFLFHIATPTAVFDVERDLLTDDLGATSTMAEQLTGMAFLCADDFACPDQSPHQVDLVMVGPGYQGDRYQDASGRQEQVEYRMGPHVMDAPTEWTARITDVIGQETAIDAILANPSVQSQIAHRPLHTSGMLLAVAGAANADGDVYRDGFTGLETRWGLYYGTDTSTASRIRIKASYSYYGTSADELSDYYDLTTFLPCLSPDTSLITDTLVGCSLVSPY